MSPGHRHASGGLGHGEGDEPDDIQPAEFVPEDKDSQPPPTPRRRRRRRRPSPNEAYDAGYADAQADARSTVQEEKVDPGVHRLNLVRGYALLVVGIGLIFFSFIGDLKPGALTLGGALVGFNPLFRATISGGHHE